MNEGREHKTSLQSTYLQSLWKKIFCGQHMIWEYDKPVQYGVLQIHKSGATTTISSILTTPLVSSEMKSWQCCAWIKLKIKEIKKRITWTLFSFEKKYFSCCWMLTRYFAPSLMNKTPMCPCPLDCDTCWELGTLEIINLHH